MPSLATRIARKAFRPLYRPYYRLLWRRRFPGSAAVERLVGHWEAASGRADVPLAPADWDSAYTTGFWDFLSGADEAARYGLIAGFLRRLTPGRRVLDVGCGEGVLRDHLEPDTGYHGIDLSAQAIRRAEARTAGRPHAPLTTFEVADAERWQPPQPFPAIVLNECLYYFERPIAAVRRYLDAVVPGGVLVISMYRAPRSEAITRRLMGKLTPNEEVELAHAKGRWHILVYFAS